MLVAIIIKQLVTMIHFLFQMFIKCYALYKCGKHECITNKKLTIMLCVKIN